MAREGIGMGKGDDGFDHSVVIHWSDRFPVVATACDVRAPSTDDWSLVSCAACIEMRVAFREVEDERAGPRSSSWNPAASMSRRRHGGSRQRSARRRRRGRWRWP
jgi:hypothetical protein